MTSEVLVSPSAAARFVVTLPPSPSRLEKALKASPGADLLTLTDTSDAFRHLAMRAKGRLVIMVPFIDRTGAAWAREMFQSTEAEQRILILRDPGQLSACGRMGEELRSSATSIHFYGSERGENDETFHSKIVLADGVAAYVGSANLLRRSKNNNLECGLLVEGSVVMAIMTFVNAILAIFED